MEKGPGVVCLPFKSQGFQRDCFHLIKSPREWVGGSGGFNYLEKEAFSSLLSPPRSFKLYLRAGLCDSPVRNLLLSHAAELLCFPWFRDAVGSSLL